MVFHAQVISTLAEDSSGLAEPKHVPYRYAPSIPQHFIQ